MISLTPILPSLDGVLAVVGMGNDDWVDLFFDFSSGGFGSPVTICFVQSKCLLLGWLSVKKTATT